jgi:hypothetical protein
MVELLSPLPWAQRHFASVDLGDQRRTQRVVIYAAAAAHAPCQSIPQQCGGIWARTKGAYRLFEQPDVTFDKLQHQHRQLTMAAAAERSVTLFLSDTTTLSFNHPATTGLGPTTGKNRNASGGCGMLLHTTLAVDVSQGIDASPFVLGLGHQQLWTRAARSKAKAKVPESIKWQRGIEAIGTPPAGVRWIHVGDSESDCWEAIAACQQQGSGFALRACQNRCALSGHASADAAESAAESTLFELLAREPALGNKKLWVRGRQDRQARWAQLAVSATPVTLLAPRNWSQSRHRRDTPRPQPIRCWAVRVYEINAPADQEPIEWVILTEEPVSNLATALKVVFWYSCRWLIEEYHKCLKSGCQVEKRQLEEASRLKALLGILTVVAVRLLQLKHQAKVNPKAAALSVVPQHYVQTLAAYLKQSFKRKGSFRKMTTQEFWRETARLGGFLARKSDGDPGWLTLWRGWQQLEVMTTGFQLRDSDG